jgi:hypothetical protein
MEQLHPTITNLEEVINKGSICVKKINKGSNSGT